MQEAERHDAEAVRLLGAVAEDGALPDYVGHLADAHATFCRVLTRMGRLDAAAGHARVAVDLGAKLVADHPRSAGYRLTLAYAQNQRGRLLREQRGVEEAEAAFRAALDQLDKVAQAEALTPVEGGVRASYVADLGGVLDDAGKHAEADAAYREAIAGLEDAAARHPDAAELLARTWCDLGRLHMEAGREDEAISCIAEARAGYEGLARSDAGRSREGAARCLSLLGEILHHKGRPADAEMAFRGAIEQFAEIEKAGALTPRERQDRDGALINFGRLLAEAGKVADAEGSYRNAILDLEDLVADRPDEPGPRFFLANGWLCLGALLRGAGRTEEAVACLGKALPLYADPPPAHRGRAAGNMGEAGRLLLECGRLAEGEQAVRAAIDGFAKLAEEGPLTSVERGDRAAATSNLGILLARSRPAEAEALFRDAVADLEDLAAEQPDDPKRRSCLAALRRNLATLLVGAGKADAAATALEAAAADYSLLVRRCPDIPSYRDALAGCLDSLGQQLAAAGRHADATEAFRACVDAREEIVRADRSAANRVALANSLDVLGSLLLNERPADAAAAFLHGLEFREGLLREAPGDPGCQCGLGGTLHNHANALVVLGRKEEAPALYERAIALQRAALATDPSTPCARDFLALHYEKLSHVLLGLNDHARAAAAATGLAETNPGSAPSQFQAGRCLVRCAEFALRDERLDEAQRARAAKAYALQAGPILVRATELAPGEILHWVVLADACVHAEDWKGSIAALSRDLGPGGGAFEWFLLATAHAQLGRKDEARRWYDKAVAWMEERGEKSEARVAQRAEVARLLGVE